MRLKEVERGDTALYRMLTPFISFVSGMRLPDAARAVFYHKDFFGGPMSAWTQATMRGESTWSVGERELIAAMTAKWNSCPFCIGAHGAIAARVLGKPVVNDAMNDNPVQLSDAMKAVLPFLEKLTKIPDQLTKQDAQAVLQKGVSVQALEDAIAACVLFNITTRCADGLGYEMLDDGAFDKAAAMMLKRGYNARMGAHPAHPDHQVMAETLRKAVLEGPGVVTAELRQAIAKRAGGGPVIDEPYDDLAKKIDECAYKVTDDQVKVLVQKTGSEKAAYEVIVTAAMGAGLRQWDKAEHVLAEVK